MPLLFLALVLGAGWAAYEFSPKTHAWVDDHVRAIRGAIAAHQSADAHLVRAQDATNRGDHEAAAQLVVFAITSNRNAAEQTGRAALTAKTEDQRSIAAQSADVVTKRDEKIMTALAKLGVGQCGVKAYRRVTPQVRDKLIAKLHAEGMTVTGDNPWEIDTHEHGVKLRAVWDPTGDALTLIVTAGADGFAGALVCDVVWGRIEPIMKQVIG